MLKNINDWKNAPVWTPNTIRRQRNGFIIWK